MSLGHDWARRSGVAVTASNLRAGARLLAVAGAFALAGCAAKPPLPAPFALAGGSFVDLTHDAAEDGIFWPTAAEFRLEEVAHGETEGGWHYSAYNIFTAEHGGTHLDAPIHFAEGGQATHEVSISRLIGPVFVLDVTEQSAADRDYLVSVDDLRAWEAEHGRLPDNAILLVRTGFSTFWPDKAAYLGTAERGAAAVPKLHFPGLSPELARFLVEERSVGAVGIDTASLDRGQSADFMAHRILAAADVPGFENVAQLDRLPATGATVIALPMKIRGGSGGPLRIVAHLPGPPIRGR